MFMLYTFWAWPVEVLRVFPLKAIAMSAYSVHAISPLNWTPKFARDFANCQPERPDG
jgi:hypothetical protein